VAALNSLFAFDQIFAHLAREGILLGAIVTMAWLGLILFPRKPHNRIIVKREVLMAASLALLASSVLLLPSLFNCQTLLAILEWHPLVLGSGLMMAAAPGVLTLEQKEEFTSILRGLRPYGPMLEDLPKTLSQLQGENERLSREFNALKKSAMGGKSALPLAAGRYVSEDCAEYLAAIAVLGASQAGKLNSKDGSRNDALVSKARSIIGIQQRDALTTSDIPLPVLYAKQVSELVWQYGQARKCGTVFPMGAGTVQWPRLKTDPIFSYMATSGAVPEKKPALEYVEFAAKKFGGIVRVPTEIDEDSLDTFGQFLARYIARNAAKIEDLAFFTGTGDGTYGGIKGITKAAIDAGNVETLAGGKTKPSDMSLTNWRNVRAYVSDAALANSCYCCNRTMDSLLVTFNTLGQPLIYRPEQGGQPATLDGYPIHWVGVLPPYGTIAQASATPVLFGDLTYGYLGLRREIDVQTSRDVYFATDEIGIRVLERFDIHLMADDAAAAVQLAAA
jgi:HK97 family phage major capsid protein